MSATQNAATLYQLQQIDLELDRLTTEQQALSNSLQGTLGTPEGADGAYKRTATITGQSAGTERG